MAATLVIEDLALRMEGATPNIQRSLCAPFNLFCAAGDDRAYTLIAPDCFVETVALRRALTAWPSQNVKLTGHAAGRDCGPLRRLVDDAPHESSSTPLYTLSVDVSGPKVKDAHREKQVVWESVHMLLSGQMKGTLTDSKSALFSADISGKNVMLQALPVQDRFFFATKARGPPREYGVNMPSHLFRKPYTGLHVATWLRKEFSRLDLVDVPLNLNFSFCLDFLQKDSSLEEEAASTALLTEARRDFEEGEVDITLTTLFDGAAHKIKIVYAERGCMTSGDVPKDYKIVFSKQVHFVVQRQVDNKVDFTLPRMWTSEPQPVFTRVEFENIVERLRSPDTSVVRDAVEELFYRQDIDSRFNEMITDEIFRRNDCEYTEVVSRLILLESLSNYNMLLTNRLNRAIDEGRLPILRGMVEFLCSYNVRLKRHLTAERIERLASLVPSEAGTLRRFRVI